MHGFFWKILCIASSVIIYFMISTSFGNLLVFQMLRFYLHWWDINCRNSHMQNLNFLQFRYFVIFISMDWETESVIAGTSVWIFIFLFQVKIGLYHVDFIIALRNIYEKFISWRLVIWIWNFECLVFIYDKTWERPKGGRCHVTYFPFCSHVGVHCQQNRRNICQYEGVDGRKI
jgi:hypothetical protein